MNCRKLNWALAGATVALIATVATAAALPPGGPPPGGPPPAGPSRPPAPAPPPASPPPPTTAPSPAGQSFPDRTGQSTSISLTGSAPASSPFFSSLGTNGRACSTCHRPAYGWTITPSLVQAAFNASEGTSPLFRTVDGSNSPLADVSTPAARRNAYSMLINRAVIRVGLPVPAGADFSLTAVSDPYGFASASELSLFRRPLPATNLAFLSTVMWDGRETTPGKSIDADLIQQAISAIDTHEQGAISPSSPLLPQIVAFESGLYTAQTIDDAAGALDALGADGGPGPLSAQPFSIGINNPPAFNPDVFTIYDSWGSPHATPSQQSIARGEAIFNTKPIRISGVNGFNDVLKQQVVVGTCSTCHDAPNAGSHSVPVFLDLGLTDAVRRTPDMPLYTLRNLSTGQVRQTTDPGLALITGHFADIGKFKVPTLRGLPARAPYFHNGSANDAGAVINFYTQRFQVNFTPQERSDLAAFLNSL